MGLTLLIIAFAIGGPALAFELGRRYERDNPVSDDCKHKFWTPWTPVPILDAWGKGKVVGPGQRHECLACGYAEVREVVTS